jgi:hypothetical protein
MPEPLVLGLDPHDESCPGQVYAVSSVTRFIPLPAISTYSDLHLRRWRMHHVAHPYAGQCDWWRKFD